MRLGRLNEASKLRSELASFKFVSLPEPQLHWCFRVVATQKKSDNVVVTDPAPISIPISQPTVENVTPTPEATAPTEPTPEPQEPTGESPSEVVPGSSSDSMEPPISSGDTTTGMDSSLNPYSGPTLSSAYATDQEAPQAELPSNTLNILQRVLATLFIWLRRVVR